MSDGAISGTYTGTSFGPDSLDDRIVSVSGSVNENDGYVQLFIGGVFSLRGTMANDGRISGTATYRGSITFRECGLTSRLLPIMVPMPDRKFEVRH